MQPARLDFFWKKIMLLFFFFRMTEEVLREVVSLVAVLKLIISEAVVKYPHRHLLIHQTICVMEHTHEHTGWNLDVFLYHFHLQLTYFVFEV